MSDLTGKKILVVEDEANLRELVTARLEANGYEVAVAEDGHKALQQAREFKPDLIILDLMLPKMEGYTVCQILRSGTTDKQVPIILFSARVSEDDRERGIDCGANAYVTKPFDPPVLLSKIHELLDPEGWAAEQEIRKARQEAEREWEPVEEEEPHVPQEPEEQAESKPEHREPEAEPAATQLGGTAPDDRTTVEPELSLEDLPLPETPGRATLGQPPGTELEPVDDETIEQEAALPDPPEPVSTDRKTEPSDSMAKKKESFLARLFRKLFGKTAGKQPTASDKAGKNKDASTGKSRNR